MEIDEQIHNNYFINKFTSVLGSYPIEKILIGIAFLLTIIPFLMNLRDNKTDTVKGTATAVEVKSTIIDKPANNQIDSKTIFVDVSGAVNKPGVYEATPGARIADLIEMAEGISHEADVYFVARNFNMARMVGDQDKIYVPFMFDIALGTFSEESRILEYLQPLYPHGSTESEEQSAHIPTASENFYKVSINNSTIEELDTLPGVGPVTAQKVIDNRPYQTVDELISKKVMNQSTFNKINEFIEL